MKRSIPVLLALFLGIAPPAYALVGFSAGVKAGMADYQGDVLPGSGDLGSDVAYGVFLRLSAVPFVDLEFHTAYFARDFTYTYMVGGQPVEADMQFRDISVMVLAKKDIFRFPVLPLGLYAGGGVGWHLINTELAKDIAQGNFDPGSADNPFSLFNNSAKMAAHVLGGVHFAPKLSPISLYGEARYGRIFTDDGLGVLEVEGGISLGF